MPLAVAHLRSITEFYRRIFVILREITGFYGILLIVFMEKNRMLRDKMGFFRDFIGFHGKKREITGFQGAKLDFTGKNEILREITGFCGREREIMGFYGKLTDFTVKCGILQENICYFTGDYRVLPDNA